MDKDTKKNQKEFWNESEKYFDEAHDSKAMFGNPALKRLYKRLKPGMKVLDVGCGEGSKIIHAYQDIKNLKCAGIDGSKIGIQRARKQNKNIKFLCHDIEKLSFKDNTFNITYSTYVFEHTTKPQKILNEMIRVTKKGGKVIIVCPNFGSPLYPSPVTHCGKHFVRAILRDFKYIGKKPKELGWYPETPDLSEGWKSDYDTTILPYVYSLKKMYPKARASSTWKGMPAGGSPRTRIIRVAIKALGLLGLYPFRWWGSTLYFELTKI